MIFFPLAGHSGYGTWHDEASYNHYIHHSKFNWNYGSSPLWDHIMGTNYVPNATQSSARERIAAEQAAIAGGTIGTGFKEATATSHAKRL